MSDGKSVPSRRESRREWALGWLDETSDLSPAQAQSQWLRNLAEQDFVPYEGSFDAFQVLSNQDGDDPASCAHEVQINHERQLVEAVESLADQFFQLPPDERRLRWESYSDACQECPRAIDHLQRLKPGLDVVLPEPTGDSQLDELSRTTGRLFTLSPLLRSQQIQVLLKRVKQDAASWEATAQQLERRRPDIAALLPDLYRRLTSLQKQVRRESVRITRRRKDSQRVETPSSSTTGVPWYWWLVGVMVIRAVASPAMRLFDSTPSSPSPKITFPQSQPENQFRIRDSETLNDTIKRLMDADREVQAPGERSISPAVEKEQLRVRLAEISSEEITLLNEEANRKPDTPRGFSREARLKSLRSEAERLWKRLKELDENDAQLNPGAREPLPNLDDLGPEP